MILESGTRLGPYEIVGPIGAGGMGEVYRGRDRRLDRDVAIKVLSSALADAPLARERFHREARAISQLTHPNICALFDIGDEEGEKYLVMELLDGTTLAECLGSGRMPLEDVLRYGAQIADALAFAHANGVVHRDLKPGNVMIMKSGAKVLDFGLAKSIAPAPPVDSSRIATQQKDLTVAGSIIGTPQYMSPEQIEGREADARTDIFAFGAMLYEMATGEVAFGGANRPAIMAAILQNEVPPVSARQPQAPPSLDRLVRMCLAKDPDARWQSMHDVAAQLRWIGEEISRGGSAAPAGSRRWLWAAAAAGAVAIVALSLLAFNRPSATPPAAASRFTLRLPTTAVLYPFSGPVAISPDGRTIAFFAHTEGTYTLWIRPLGSLEATRIAGSEGGSMPFWSPDSRRVGFVAGEKLKIVDLEAGSVEAIADVPSFATGSFNADGDIIVGSIGGAVLRIPAAGGTPRAVTTVDRSRGEIGHDWPSFLPDGKRFLYLARNSDPERTAIRLASVDGKENSHILRAASNAVYANPGYILYAAGDKLLAAPFDPDEKKLGPAQLIADHVWAFNGGALFSASADGTIVYATAARIRTSLAWCDRGGQRLTDIPSEGDVIQVELTSAGDRILLEQMDPSTGVGVIWQRDAARGTASRLTFGDWTWSPIWSEDGRDVALTSYSGKGLTISLSAADGSGRTRVLVEDDALINAGDLAGGNLIYTRADSKNRYDIWWLPRDETSPRPFFGSPFDEVQPQVSPDGRWIAYSSNESGRLEVHVRSFPAGGDRIPISLGGGTQPRWSRDGRELFYVSANDELMSVAFAPGQTRAATPKSLFRFAPRRHFNNRFDYDVAPDGGRFILNERAASEGGDIVVVTNWPSLVDKQGG